MPALLCPACGGSLDTAPVGYLRFVCVICGRTCNKAAAIPAVPPVRRARRQTTRGRSDRQERHTAKTYGGTRTLNSGALDDKADVKVKDKLRIEDKTTSKRSYVLRLDDLMRLEAQTKGDEMPVLKISFEDNLNQQYCVVPQHWFDNMLAREEEE